MAKTSETGGDKLLPFPIPVGTGSRAQPRFVRPTDYCES
jgi:hypothetical protein